MSSWTIYWILQLDSIGSTVSFLAFMSSVVTVIAAIYFMSCKSASPETWCSPEFKADEQRKLDRAPEVAKFARKCGAVAIVFIVASGLLPSTKTASAMVIVPAIVNNETLKKETGELYQLAKQALKSAVADDKAEKKP